eukprot:7547793-Pyramimonas_sp.AAC.1
MASIFSAPPDFGRRRLTQLATAGGYLKGQVGEVTLLSVRSQSSQVGEVTIWREALSASQIFSFARADLDLLTAAPISNLRAHYNLAQVQDQGFRSRGPGFEPCDAIRRSKRRAGARHALRATLLTLRAITPYAGAVGTTGAVVDALGLVGAAAAVG